jgi:SAM-dependent methyltransferase
MDGTSAARAPRGAATTGSAAAAAGSRGRTACRFCGGALRPMLDLGTSPLCETFLPAEALDAGEAFYPLATQVCPGCWLVQLGEYVTPERIFGADYPYFSSYSEAWLAHARDYAEAVAARLGLGPRSRVLEVASNDGYLLRNFVAAGIPCLGVEPAASVAAAAERAGVPTRVAFFGRRIAEGLAAEWGPADLVVGNNVFAHVPDLNDFAAGLRAALAPEGVLTLEFPHLLRLMAGNQFDTIYHEHFCYFSFSAAERVLAAHGLRVFDAEELWTHGGSLRVFACRAEAATHATAPAPARLRAEEEAAGLGRLETYEAFGERVRETKRRLLEMLIGLKRDGKRVVGYGAPGKGNTLLNYCGLRTDFLDFTVDRNPHKHGRYLPGTRVPVLAPEALDAARPDVVLVLPWNLKDEIMRQLAHIRSWGGRFLLPIPEPTLVD